MARPQTATEDAVREIYRAHCGMLAGWATKLVGDPDPGHDFATEAARNGWAALRHEAGGFLAVPCGERGAYYLGSHDGLTWRKVQVAGAP